MTSVSAAGAGFEGRHTGCWFDSLARRPPRAPPPTADPPEPAADFTPPAPPREAEADEQLRDSVRAQGLFDRAVEEATRGDENAAVVHFLRASKLAEAAREWFLAATAAERLGDAYRSPGDPYDLGRAVRMYYRAVADHERCGMFREARELAYRVSCLKMRRGRELGLRWWVRAELFLFWLVAGFGFRPVRVLLTAAAVVLAFALVYWATGGVVTQAGQAVGDFPTAVYFSGITFATVGFGEFVPAPHARFLAMAEGALGFVTVSFFVVVLVNRLRY